MISDKARSLARLLWEYHSVRQEIPPKVDLMLVAGSHDTSVAEHAAKLYGQVSFGAVVASGGRGKITSETQSEPEALRFRDIMEAHGVPVGAVLIEDQASNTGENVTFTHRLLSGLSIVPRTAVIVTKPYMARRAIATAEKQWSELQWFVSAPDVGFDQYAVGDAAEERMLNLMVGDLQRVRVYAELGFQTPQPIPSEVWRAYERLVELGYDKHVIAT